MSAGHLDRLRDAMRPDPREWEYTGRVNDTGVLGGSECACGQAIRYEFILERPRDGARLVIGSQCIETSVPYLIERGATGLATRLQRAHKEHSREVARGQREAKALAALPGTRADVERLIEWFRGEGERFHERAAEWKHIVIRMPEDLTASLTPPAKDAEPGRALGVIRRVYPRAWLRALRFAHEHDAEIPPLPADPDLRERVGKAVRGHRDDPTSEFAAACAFAGLAYRSEADAREGVPAPASAATRRGYTERRRPPRDPDAEAKAERERRKDHLRQALELPQDPETEERLRTFEEAMRRRRSAS